MGSKFISTVSFYWKVLKQSVSGFVEEHSFTQSAALSYYTVFSLPPMLIIIFWLVGIWYEEVLVREAVFDEFAELIGQEGANKLMTTLERLTSNQPTLWKTIIGVGTLFFTASTVFVTMKEALNRIFKVKVVRSVKKGITMMILDRFLSIAMLCIIAFILTLSMVISTLITAFNEVIEKWLGDTTRWLFLFDTFLLNLIVFTLLFAITFRYMPDKRLKWRDTWFGAIFTAVLFIGGKSLIGVIISNSQLANFYDAAGGILVLMLWVYYTSVIFFFGANVTHHRSVLLKESKNS